jgi:hypothetical protein
MSATVDGAVEASARRESGARKGRRGGNTGQGSIAVALKGLEDLRPRNRLSGPHHNDLIVTVEYGQRLKGPALGNTPRLGAVAALPLPAAHMGYGAS